MPIGIKIHIEIGFDALEYWNLVSKLGGTDNFTYQCIKIDIEIGIKNKKYWCLLI